MTTPKTEPEDLRRTNKWLRDQLDSLWATYFSDIEKTNIVTIRFARASRTRLGTIKGSGGVNPRKDPVVSEIRINDLLAKTEVPEIIVHHTIVHEVCHYVHGFCSPRPQKYRHPHRGKIIEQELGERNLLEMYKEAEKWLKTEWRPYVLANLPNKARTKRRLYARTRPEMSILSYLNARIAGHPPIRRRRSDRD